MRAGHCFLGLGGLILAAAVAQAAGRGPASSAPAPSPMQSSANGKSYVAALLTNEARDTLRDANLPAGSAARQATVLLQYASHLNPADQHLLKMLAEAARTCGNTDLEKETLRSIIAADSGNLVAQVKYIDLIAAGAQSMDDRARVYQGALDQASLNAQIRSVMALRLARISQERGDSIQARQFLEQSIRLNDLNVEALRAMVQLAAAESHSLNGPVLQMRALVALLTADPYQPDAWLQAARLCETGTIHDRAADLLSTAVEQAILDGAPVGGEMYLELAMEQAIAGHPDAFQNALSLAQIPDAPLEALLIAQFLAQSKVYGSAAGQATTQSASDKLVPETRKVLAEMVKAGEEAKRPTAYADAAGAELSFLPTTESSAAEWIGKYASQVPADDPTLGRLRGWQLYRQGDLSGAQAALEKLAPSDPLAQVGLARVLLAQGKTPLAARELQDVWSNHPTGLLALQVAETARRNHITLTETPWSAQLREAAARLTPAVTNMHREPRDVVLISLQYKKPTVSYGESQVLTIRMTNTSEKTVPVGRDGVVRTAIGLAGTIREGNKSLGIFGVEDFQRAYRLGPHQIIEDMISLDQGKLADFLQESPDKTFTVGVMVLTAPRLLTGGEFTVGVGGQALTIGDYERTGMQLNTAADATQLARDLTAASGERRLICIDAACAFLAELLNPAAAMPGKDDSKAKLIEALRPLATSSDALVRATFVHRVPFGADAELDKSIAALASDSDSLVRLLWARHEEILALRGGDSAVDAAASLERRAGEETDPQFKEWLNAAVPVAKEASTLPATMPATVPATTQAEK